VATFLEAFPNGVVFANTTGGQGYDLVLLGRLDDEPIDLDRIDARLRAPENEAVARSLGDIGIYSAVDLFGTYAGSVADMGGWLAGAQINRDLNLRLQYLAGLGLNQYDADRIYRNMVAESQYPEGLFTGSPERLDAVRQRISQAMRISGNTNFF
jgi:spermidine synthase